MAAKMFDRCDLADWELGVDIALGALDIPALLPHLPSFAPRPAVLELTEVELVQLAVLCSELSFDYQGVKHDESCPEFEDE